jgi:hypothetical protein
MFWKLDLFPSSGEVSDAAHAQLVQATRRFITVHTTSLRCFLSLSQFVPSHFFSLKLFSEYAHLYRGLAGHLFSSGFPTRNSCGCSRIFLTRHAVDITAVESASGSLNTIASFPKDPLAIRATASCEGKRAQAAILVT